jgi:hypothetical protein
MEPRDLDNIILLRVAVSVLHHRDLHAEAVHFLETGGGTVGIAIAEIDEEIELRVCAWPRPFSLSGFELG